MGKLFQPAGTSNPLTTKGDLFTRSTTDARFPVGINGQFLKADSTQTTGLIWGSGSANLSVVSKVFSDSPYAATTADDVILYDVSGGASNINLPTAVGNKGKVFYIKKTSADFIVLTVTANGTEKFDGSGSSTTTLNTQNEAIGFVSDNVGWQILERKIPSTFISFVSSGSQGIGASTITARRRRVGGCLEFSGRVLTGTSTAAEARVNFIASGETITSDSGITTIEYCGGAIWDTASASQFNVLIEPSVSYVTFSLQNGTNAGLTKQTGSSIFGNTKTFSFRAMIPIAGWAT